MRNKHSWTLQSEPMLRQIGNVAFFSWMTSWENGSGIVRQLQGPEHAKMDVPRQSASYSVWEHAWKWRLRDHCTLWTLAGLLHTRRLCLVCTHVVGGLLGFTLLPLTVTGYMFVALTRLLAKQGKTQLLYIQDHLRDLYEQLSWS